MIHIQLVSTFVTKTNITRLGFFMDRKEIQSLLDKPLWQMTGSEYVTLHAYACTTISSDGAHAVTQVKGVHAVAEYCACSDSQIAKLLREGVLDSAIVSRIGKSIVFDADKARNSANVYQEQKRSANKKEDK